MGEPQSLPDVELTAKYELDDEWNQIGELPSVISAASPEERQLREWIRETTIKIAPQAETLELTPPPGSGPGYVYLKSEVGMNIVLPKGHINELRFMITLTQDGGTEDTQAIDGFPKSQIQNTAIVNGHIKISISSAFNLIPVIGPVAAQLLPVELYSWSFHVGSLKHIDVAFSGGLTPTPDWYFKKAGLRNDKVRIAMTLKKSKASTRVKAEVQAAWDYKPGMFRSKRVATETKTVAIYGPV